MNHQQKVAFVEAQSAMLNVKSAMYQVANRIASSQGKPPVHTDKDFQKLIDSYKYWLDAQNCITFLKATSG